MMKYVIGWLVTALILGASALHYYGKVSGLREEAQQLEREVKAEQAKTQAVIEEYNALQKLYDKGQRNKVKSKESTESAKAQHRSTGTITRASEPDYQLLQQRSREVRGETSGTSGRPDGP